MSQPLMTCVRIMMQAVLASTCPAAGPILRNQTRRLMVLAAALSDGGMYAPEADA